MKTQGPYHLIWHYKGAMRGQRFRSWSECEAFSKRLIAAGLTPKLTPESPCPYDEKFLLENSFSS